MSKQDIIKYIYESNLSISNKKIVICIMMALLLGLFMYFVYRITYTGSVYSAEFAQSLVLISIVTTIIMITIQSNLALSLGMVGSLSIIRFRTAVKEVKNIFYIFWAISIGVACGAGIFVPGIVGSTVLGILLVVFSLGVYEKKVYLITAEFAGDDDTARDRLGDIIKNYSKKTKVKMNIFTNSVQKITYEVNIREKKCMEMVNELRRECENAKLCVVTYSGEAID